MKQEHPDKPDMADPARTLRVRAEELLRAAPLEVPTLPTADVQAVIHELSVHQMELEIQNEELRQAQFELADSRDRFSELYEFAPVGYLTLERNGTVREANLTAARLVRVERTRLLNSPLSKWMSGPDADKLYLHLLRAFDGGQANVCEVNLVRPDASPCKVRLESVMMEGKESPVCWTIMSNITELALAQQVAARSAQLSALGTLAAGVAHEINNPLWMIALQVEVALAAKDLPNREKVVTNCLQEIKQLVDRGGRIVNSVLRYAKQDTTEKWPHSLLEALRRARDYARTGAQAKQVEIKMTAPSQLPDLVMNPIGIEQVFVNLLQNAIEASNPGGSVLIQVEADKGVVEVRVEDQGHGMSAEERKRVFELFYSTRHEAGGTGLGMNISLRIIEDHGGTIGVSSQPRQGTIVTVRLPISENQKKT